MIIIKKISSKVGRESLNYMRFYETKKKKNWVYHRFLTDLSKFEGKKKVQMLQGVRVRACKN